MEFVVESKQSYAIMQQKSTKRILKKMLSQFKDVVLCNHWLGGQQFANATKKIQKAVAQL